MITPQEIKSKTERKYISFLQSLVEQKPFEKLVIRGDKSYTKSSLPEFEKEIQQINSQSKEKKGFGYTLEFQRVKTKYLGTQDLPVSIYFDTEKDFLRFLGKEKEVESFKTSAGKIIEAFPELKQWVIRNPIKVIDGHTEWDSFLKVCQYFQQHPKPNLYIRELPVNVHTKFIEKNKWILFELLNVILNPEYINNEFKTAKEFEKRFHLRYSEPLIRFKILDKEISQNYFSGLDDLAIPVSQFETLNLPIERVLVVENKTTFYTTLTLPKMDSAIAIFGSGYSVYNLKNAHWFSDVELFYWGDIDVQGFEILSQFRSYFLHVQSLLMDKVTFENFFENDKGTPTGVSTKLNLTEEEQQLYDMLKVNNWRLEQEKIPLYWVVQFFKIYKKVNNPRL